MKMESAVEVQQGVETAVTETESQQITSAQIATLAQVTKKCVCPKEISYYLCSGSAAPKWNTNFDGTYV